jgi:hypothetical protein
MREAVISAFANETTRAGKPKSRRPGASRKPPRTLPQITPRGRTSAKHAK